MKLSNILEENIPNVYSDKKVNSLNKKPKKLKKGVYGVGGGPIGLNVPHGTCDGSSDGTDGGGSGDAGGGSAGAGGASGGAGGGS